MFNCPTCRKETPKLIYYGEYTAEARLGCPACGVPQPRFSRCDLGQTADKWEGKDGKTHKVTTGKNWEFDQRIISKDDNKTVINKTTGKPTEY